MKTLLTLLAVAFLTATGSMLVQAQEDGLVLFGRSVNQTEPNISVIVTFQAPDGSEILCGSPEGGVAKIEPVKKPCPDCDDPSSTPEPKCEEYGELCSLGGVTGKCKNVAYPCKEAAADQMQQLCKTLKCVVP